MAHSVRYPQLLHGLLNADLAAGYWAALAPATSRLWLRSLLRQLFKFLFKFLITKRISSDPRWKPTQKLIQLDMCSIGSTKLFFIIWREKGLSEVINTWQTVRASLAIRCSLFSRQKLEELQTTECSLPSASHKRCRLHAAASTQSDNNEDHYHRWTSMLADRKLLLRWMIHNFKIERLNKTSKSRNKCSQTEKLFTDESSVQSALKVEECATPF